MLHSLVKVVQSIFPFTFVISFDDYPVFEEQTEKKKKEQTGDYSVYSLMMLV